MTSFLGATLPELSARSGFDLSRSGALFSFLYLPQVPMVFLAGPLIDRFGKKLVLAAGFLFSAAALVGMAYTPSYAVLGTLLVMLGLGSSSAMAAANTLIPDLYPDESFVRAQSGKHLFWSRGVLFSLAGGCADAKPGSGGHHVVRRPAGRLVAFVALAQKFPPASMAGGFDWGQAMSVAVNPAVIILACVLFFYTALGVSTSGWIRTFLERISLLRRKSPKFILTAFWIMMMLGRLSASQVVKRVRGPQLVLGCSLGAIAGLLLIVLATNVLMAAAGIILCGCPTLQFSYHGGNGQHLFFAHLRNRVRNTHGPRPAERGGGSRVPSVMSPSTDRAFGIWILVVIAVLLLLTQIIFNSYEKKKLLPSRP